MSVGVVTLALLFFALVVFVYFGLSFASVNMACSVMSWFLAFLCVALMVMILMIGLGVV